MYEAVSLYKGRRIIASKGDKGTNFRVHQLILYCLCGVLAGIVGGLLGLGGGFILGPLFLELGVPPQVSLCGFLCEVNLSSYVWLLELVFIFREELQK